MTVRDSFLLAERLKDDTIWKTVNLAGAPIPYTSAAAVALKGVGVKGRPVEETVLLYRVSNAWETMLANPGHPLDTDMFARYGTLLGAAAKPLPHIPEEKEPETAAVRIFEELYPDEPLLAAVCANHLLVNGGVGLFGVYPKQIGELSASIEAGDERWIRNNAVELLPGGLTRERMRLFNGR